MNKSSSKMNDDGISRSTKEPGKLQDVQVIDTLRQNIFHHVGYLIVIVGGFVIGAMFYTRLTVTVAMLSMVNHTHLYITENRGESIDLFEPGYVEKGEFNWSNEIQQTISSGYMVAYTIPQVIATRLGEIYGIRLSILVGLSICGISCLLVPVLVYWGWGWLLALRLINGIGASGLLPSMIGAVEDWIPGQDSAFGLSLLQFVQTFFLVSAPLTSGQLTSIHWKWAFYVPGAMAVLLACSWWLIASDDPKSCPYISQKELDMLQRTNEKGEELPADKEIQKVERPNVDFFFMFRIKSFYFFTLIWILYCSSLGGTLFLLPSYFHKILNLSIKDNGFYNFVIQLGVLFSMLWPNAIIPPLQNRFAMSLTSARRVVVFIYSFMSIITYLYIAAYHENQIIALMINRFFNMTNDSIVTATLMSQFGKYGLSRSVFSMVNTIGNFSTVFFCWATGRLLDYTGESRECWSCVFIVVSIMNAMIFIIYFFFLDSEPAIIKERKSIDLEKGGKD